NVYGPRQDPKSPYSGVISKFIAALRAGGPVDVFGDGQQMRDFIYIDDVAEGLVRAMDAAMPAAPVVNLCVGKSWTINELAVILGGLMRVDVIKRHLPPVVGDIRISRGDNQKARQLLRFQPSIDLPEGLARLLQ